MHAPKPGIFLFGFLFALLGCQPASSQEDATLKDAITFYASFDEGFKADYAAGDPVLYTVPSWNMDSTITVIDGSEGLVERLASGGKSGGALRFSTNWDPVVFYKAVDNVRYEEENWSGSFSFWLRVDPEEGLQRGYSDPFIISDKNWDNASFYVDFTQDTPRTFRFASFSDYWSWNPEGLAWNDVPVEDRPMVEVKEMPFSAAEWTHVVLTFESVNAEGSQGVMKGYLNGEAMGTLTRDISISWETERVIMSVGRHYTGDLDDLSIYNRALTPEEVKKLYSTPVIDLL